MILRRAGGSGRQVHRDALILNHRKRHDHERREQKENDINQLFNEYADYIIRIDKKLDVVIKDIHTKFNEEVGREIQGDFK